MRPHNPIVTAAKCLGALDFDDVGAAMGAASGLRVKNYVDQEWVETQFRCLLDSTTKKFGTSSFRTKNHLSGVRMLPSTRNLTEFILEWWVAVPDITLVGSFNILATEWTSVNATKRWRVTFENEIFTFHTYTPGGAVDAVNADCTGNLANTTFYKVRILYDGPNTTSKIEIRDAANSVMGTGSSITAKVLSTPAIEDYPGIMFGGYSLASPTSGVGASNALDEGFHDSARYWASISNSIFSAAVEASPIKIYATQSGSAEFEFDSDVNNSIWDFSTLDLDDDANEAANVGDDGWEMRYEVADTLTGTYSAWMTFADFRLDADENGKLLNIQVRANQADGLSNFQPLVFLKINFTAGSITTAAPTFNSLTNDGDGDAVTLNITPPLGTGYAETEIYYRLVGAIAWIVGPTFVGTQGVAGDKQITGLTNESRYEFVLFADFGSGGFSAPSITRRIMVSSSTIKSPAWDIASFLDDQGLGTIGTDISVNTESDEPDEFITCFDTGGFDPDGAVDISNPTVMIHVRGKSDDFHATYEKARLVKNTLHRQHDIEINGSRYLQILVTGDILDLGRDKHKRPKFSINLLLMRTPA